MSFGSFKFSSDFLQLSADEFKAVMKKRYSLKVKDINELYKQLHGYNIDISPEVEEGN